MAHAHKDSTAPSGKCSSGGWREAFFLSAESIGSWPAGWGLPEQRAKLVLPAGPEALKMSGFRKPKTFKLRALHSQQKFGIAGRSCQEVLRKGCLHFQVRRGRGSGASTSRCGGAGEGGHASLPGGSGWDGTVWPVICHHQHRRSPVYRRVLTDAPGGGDPSRTSVDPRGRHCLGVHDKTL